MAILNCLPGLEVAIEVDGQRAQEYDADPDEVESRAEEFDFHSIQQTRRGVPAPYVLKYIEAKPGKPFVFVVDMRNVHSLPYSANGPVILYRCVVDGFEPRKTSVWGGVRGTKTGFRTGSNATGWKHHKFRFESLDVREYSHPGLEYYCQC